MPEELDKEVELAQYFGQDPQERIDELTRLQPVKEGSRCTNDPLQVALAQYAAQIGKTGSVFPRIERMIDSPMNLHILASEQAQELMRSYALLIKRSEASDWATLLELAFVRGFNESTMQRMNSANQELIDALRCLVILPQVDGTHAGNRAKAIIAKAEGKA